jgi:hypothetical protein
MIMAAKQLSIGNFIVGQGLEEDLALALVA